MSQETPPSISKAIWTDADFDDMGWHDAAVHGLATRPEDDHTGRLLIDLDYIIEWVPPADGETYFSFWIVPATLVFEHTWDLTLQIDHLDSAGLELELERDHPDARPAPRKQQRLDARGSQLHPRRHLRGLPPIPTQGAHLVAGPTTRHVTTGRHQLRRERLHRIGSTPRPIHKS